MKSACARHVRPGERHAIALEPAHRREAQRRRGAAGPRAQGEDHGVGVERLAVTLTPRRRAVAHHDTPRPRPGAGSAPFARAASSSAAVKRAGWTCAVVSVEPSAPATTAGPSIQDGAGHAMPAAHGGRVARGHHEGIHAPVSVVGTELAGEVGMEREARARQRTERRTVAPVQGEEAARLARGGAGHPRALDHGDRHAALGQEIGDRGAHDAGAADHDMAGRCHPPMLPQRVPPGVCLAASTRRPPSWTTAS